LRRELFTAERGRGTLIVTEAGSEVTRLDGSPFSCHPGDVLASNGPLHAEMLDAIRAATARGGRL
jgi:3'-phosphoadenosine 5'-phosphosulfate (PAPS) 3'-phosphatase